VADLPLTSEDRVVRASLSIPEPRPVGRSLSVMASIVGLPFRRPNHARHVGAGRALVCDQPILVLEGWDPGHLPQGVLATRAGKATLPSWGVRHFRILTKQFSER
jgi:hypothetical protein